MMESSGQNRRDSDLHSSSISKPIRLRSDSCLSVETLIIFGMIIFVFSILLAASMVKLLFPYCRNKPKLEDPYSIYPSPPQPPFPNMYYNVYSSIQRLNTEKLH